MYYKICHNCGCALDPGERCDCENKASAQAKPATQDKRDKAPRYDMQNSRHAKQKR